MRYPYLNKATNEWSEITDNLIKKHPSCQKTRVKI